MAIINWKFMLGFGRNSSRFIKFPKTRMEVALEMSVHCQIPQTVGAIDGTHMEINSPTGDSKIDYSDRKRRYSIST